MGRSNLPWSGLIIDPQDSRIYEQHNNRYDAISSEAFSDGNPPEEVEDAPETSESMEVETSDSEESSTDDGSDQPDFDGGDDSEGGFGDEASDDGFGGGEDDDSQDSGSFDSGGEGPEPGENPMADVLSRSTLISKLSDLKDSVQESIDLIEEIPKASVVVKKLSELLEMIDRIKESALISSPTDTMTRYELLSRHYSDLVRQLKRITIGG